MNRFTSSLLGKLALVTLLALPAAEAQTTRYWSNGTPGSPATGNWALNADGGTAAWTTISGNNNPSAFWFNGDYAVFERSAAMAIGSTGAGYTVNAGSLTMNSGVTLTLNTPVQATGVKLLTVAGASSGHLVIGGTNFDTNGRLRVELSGSYNGLIETGATGGSNNHNLLVLMNSASGGSNLRVQLNGGALVLGEAVANNTVTIGELSGAVGSFVSPTFGATTGTRTLNVNQSSNTVFAGELRAGTSGRVLALTKSGAGRLELTGANTFEGATIVNGGTLLISGGGSINGTTGVSVNGASAILRYDSSVALTRTVTYGVSGGTFLYNSAAKYTGGSGSLTAGTDDVVGGDGVLGNVTIASGGTLTPGELGAGSAGQLTVDSLTLQIGATSNFDVLSEVAFDSISSVGAIQLAGAFNLTFSSILASGSDLVLFDGASLANNFASISALGAYSGSFAIEEGIYRLQQGNQVLSFDHLTGVLSVHAIPEPSTTLLLTGGLMAVLLFRRRRYKN